MYLDRTLILFDEGNTQTKLSSNPAFLGMQPITTIFMHNTQNYRYNTLHISYLLISSDYSMEHLRGSFPDRWIRFLPDACNSALYNNDSHRRNITDKNHLEEQRVNGWKWLQAMFILLGHSFIPNGPAFVAHVRLYILLCLMGGHGC